MVNFYNQQRLLPPSLPLPVDLRYLVVALSLSVAAASLLAAAYAMLQLSSVLKELNELRRALSEVESVRQQLLDRIRELEEQVARAREGAWSPAISSDVKAIAYILPSQACTPAWRDRYGDRIYFYAYANLSEYRNVIENDFRTISLVYNTVIIVIPADDTRQYFSNLELLDELARRVGLNVMWALLPKWKYGAEQDYLKPGTRMNELVLRVMERLASLNSTWKIAVWYGWSDRRDPDDVMNFYNSLPDKLKRLYAVWLDQPYAEVARGLARYNPPFLVVTELYSEDAVNTYSGLLKHQLIVTGYYGAKSPEEWLKGIARKLQLVKGVNRYLGIWIFYDINDGHGEEYAAYRPEWRAIPNPYGMTIEPLSERS